MEKNKVLAFFETWIVTQKVSMNDFLNLNAMGKEPEHLRVLICDLLNENYPKVFTPSLMQAWFPSLPDGRIRFYIEVLAPDWKRSWDSRNIAPLLNAKKKQHQTLLKYIHSFARYEEWSKLPEYAEGMDKKKDQRDTDIPEKLEAPPGFKTNKRNLSPGCDY